MPVTDSNRHLVVVFYHDSLQWDAIVVSSDELRSLEAQYDTLIKGGILDYTVRSTALGPFGPERINIVPTSVLHCISGSLRPQLQIAIGAMGLQNDLSPVMDLDGSLSTGYELLHNYVRRSFPGYEYHFDKAPTVLVMAAGVKLRHQMPTSDLY